MSGRCSTPMATACRRWSTTTAIAPARTSSAPSDWTTRQGGEGADLGARALGIENMAVKAIQGRAVMIDLEAHFGRERKLVGFDELMRCWPGQGRDRAGRHGVPPHRLRPHGAGDEARARREAAAWRLRRARRPRRAPAQLDHPQRARRRSSPTTTPSKPRRRALAPRIIAPRCRCTRIASSSSASISASSGISRSSPMSARRGPQPLPPDRAAAAPPRRRRLAGDAGGHGVGRERHQQMLLRTAGMGWRADTRSSCLNRAGVPGIQSRTS